MQSMNKWSEEEEQIFRGLVEQVLKEHLWQAVRADGRLVHRQSSGIKAHWIAMVSPDQHCDASAVLMLPLAQQAEVTGLPLDKNPCG